MGSIATVPGFGAPGDPSAFFGGGSTEQKEEPSSTSLSLSSEAVPSTAPLSDVSVPSTAITTPTGGAGTSENLGLYSPQKPNLLSYNTGAGNMQRLYQQIYGKDDPTSGIKPPGQDALSRSPETATTTDATDTVNQTPEDYVKHGQEFIDSTNRAVGNATTFGLDYDTGGYDDQDNGKGAFGYNTRDKNLEGASLPISVIKGTIGDYEHDPKIYQSIRNGEYKVAVTNQDGTTRVVPIVDAGPAEWTGNAVDLTYKTSHDLGTQGKAKVGYQVIGPDGHPVPVKGYHPDSVSRVNYDDHIGSNRKDKPQPAKDDVEDMGEKPKQSRTETTAETDASYGRYGKDLTPEEGNKVVDDALKELQRDEEKDKEANQ
jgi:hypothetical protein